MPPGGGRVEGTVIHTPVRADTHRAAARMFASGVTIAAATDGSRTHAITATAFCSLSLDPPLVLLSVARGGQLLDLVRGGGHFGVSILSSHQQAIGEFGATSGRVPGPDIVHFDTRTAATGAPLVVGAAAWFDCVLESMADHGDHTVLIGLVVDAWADETAKPLLYFQGDFHTIGSPMPRGAGHKLDRGGVR
jgi:flavin reductase (DIM6/NTAB) family NADH-FMN oxidoreductase RutF